MADTTFQDFVTPVPAAWLQDINNHTYRDTPIAPATTVHGANHISFTPTGNISATQVQAALVEEMTDLLDNANMSNGVALVGGATRVVDSITALKALPKTGCPKAFVTGYYAAGDGGGGPYYYDSTDTTSADNGGTIIVATDGGRWKLAKTQPVTVETFGAVGTTDDTAAIQAAINFCIAGSLPLTCGPVAVHNVSHLLISGVESFSWNLSGSTLKNKDTSASPLITVLNCRGTSISNGTLDGNFGLTQTTLLKIYANNGAGSSYGVYSDLRFRNAQYGVVNGELTRPDEPYISENTLIASNFIGVLNPVSSVGVQAEINIIGGEITAGINGWVSFPPGYVVNALTAIGGNIRVTGGELTSYVNRPISIQPIASASGTLYGKVFCVGTWIEARYGIGLAENPNALLNTKIGVISLEQCSGNVQQISGTSALDSSADFKGDFRVFKCLFWASVTIANPCINSAGTANIYVDDVSFSPYINLDSTAGAGFKSGTGSFSGGVVHYYPSSVNTVAFSAYQSTLQSVPNAVWTKVQLQTKSFDTFGFFDNVTNYRFQPTIPGYYQVNGSVQIGTSSFPCAIDIYKNGVTTGYAMGAAQSGVINATACLSRLVFLNGTTDYIELFAFQSSGGALNSVTVITQFSASIIQ